MEARTGIEQALLDQIGKIQKDWNERGERLTKLVNALFNKVNGLTVQIQSTYKLTKQLEQLEKLLENG